MIESEIKNRKGRLFDLSRVDRLLIAYSKAMNIDVSTSDGQIIEFAKDQFDIANISALALVNKWIRSDLVEWNDDLNSFVREWDINDEPIQPGEDILEFEGLTGLDYVGS